MRPMFRTLLVDDDFLVGSYLKTLNAWEKAGYEVVKDVQDGEEALHVLEAEKIDAVSYTHLLSNAMLLKECLTFALEGAYDRFADLGRAVGVAVDTDSDKEASEKFLAAVEAITKELETPTLGEFGIDKDEFFKVIDKMAFDAMDSGSPQKTMREVTEDDVKQIYRNLW